MWCVRLPGSVPAAQSEQFATDGAVPGHEPWTARSWVRFRCAASAERTERLRPRDDALHSVGRHQADNHGDAQQEADIIIHKPSPKP